MAEQHLPSIEFIHWYQSPGRYYHTLNHIYECLVHFHGVKHLLLHPQLVWTAIWFHDCVYSVQPNAHNEELSAAEARHWVKNDLDRHTVTNLILVTKHSDKYPPMTTDEAFMCDIDLAILGSDPDQYATYAANIREEYRIYDDAAYNLTRIAILKGFLKKAEVDLLYYTAHFRALYGRQARENLIWEINKLESINIAE